uniref:Uncharacterized protein n=1 Tax=Rhizophora mucronata TaxID=61149 RepID=A0A2P2IJL5_RHIMU
MKQILFALVGSLNGN